MFQAELIYTLMSDAASTGDTMGVERVFNFVSGDAGVGPLILVGLAVLVAIPVLVLIGSVFGAFTSRSKTAHTSDHVDVAPSERTSRVDDASTETLVAKPKTPTGSTAADPKRLTTQALRSPPRSGRAKILIVQDDNVGMQELAGDEETTGRRSAKNGAEATVGAARGAGNRPRSTAGRQNGRIHVFAQGDLLRIGREDDNDIVLSSKTVHRYHAVVRRTRDAGYVLVDLSGADGNGVRVNGERIMDAQLRDGDDIVLGTAELKFVLDH